MEAYGKVIRLIVPTRNNRQHAQLRAKSTAADNIFILLDISCESSA